MANAGYSCVSLHKDGALVGLVSGHQESILGDDQHISSVHVAVVLVHYPYVVAAMDRDDSQ